MDLKRKIAKEYLFGQASYGILAEENGLRDKSVVKEMALRKSAITYLSINGKYGYLILITNAYSRKVVGYNVDISQPLIIRLVTL